ncbi:helix-turn-helix domain-containing protein [Providencia sp. Je.9.19]|uniref:helix-turn-helix domain-containing protein n=1 Tax=Providencia sp. Je.9.19 TaxID=3142844 RepID=UPI003DAA3B1E
MSNYYLPSKIVGNRILYYRKMKGVTATEISKIIGISEQQQSRYERGINRINLDRLFQYAIYFEISIQDLFINNDEENLEIKSYFKNAT